VAAHLQARARQSAGRSSIERKGFTFFFPITSSIVVSLLITLVLWIFRR
jgi:hypothetical protein